MHTEFDWNDAPNMRGPGAPGQGRTGQSSAAEVSCFPEIDGSQAPGVRARSGERPRGDGPSGQAAWLESDLDWSWEGWNRALTVHAEISSRSYLRLRKASTDVALAPVAVLTDATRLLEAS